MTESNFNLPTQYRIDSVTINGVDVIGLFQSIEIFESIYSTGITGTIKIMDSDFAGFIENGGKKGGEPLEYIEPISFTFTNALGEELIFDGYLSGMRDEVVKQKNKLYSIDFVSQSIRNDDEVFIVRAYKDVPPEEIIEECIDIIASQGGSSAGLKSQIIGRGEPMNFVAGRRKPTKVMTYVCDHASDTSGEGGSVSVEEGEQEGEAKGSGGFLCWETIDGYRFCSISQIKQIGNGGSNYPFNVFKDYEYTLANREKSLEEKMLEILEHQFPKMADYDDKRKSGANNHVLITYDMDKGEYVELSSVAEADKDTTKLQSEDNKNPTRYKTAIIQNEKMNGECKLDKENDDEKDQTRKVSCQSLKSQTTFDDQHGRFTLAPRFSMRAGDAIDVKIRKFLIGAGEGEEESAIDRKHSGMYIIQQVGHHIFADGKAYTKIQSLRTLTDQTDDSANEPSKTPANTSIPAPLRRPLPDSPTSIRRGNKILYGI